MTTNETSLTALRVKGQRMRTMDQDRAVAWLVSHGYTYVETFTFLSGNIVQSWTRPGNGEASLSQH